MQSSSGLINIHELRWLGDWLVVPAGGRGRQAGPQLISFRLADVSFSSVCQRHVEDRPIHSVMQQKPHFDVFSSRNRKQYWTQ